MANLEDDKGVPLWVRLCTAATCVWQGPGVDGAPPHGVARRPTGGRERVIDVLSRLYGATMVRYGESWLNSDGPDYTRVGERLVVEQGLSVASIYDIGPRDWVAEAQRANSETHPPLRPQQSFEEAWHIEPAKPRKATLDLVKERISLGPRISLLMVNNVDDVVALLCEQVDELWRVLDGADEEAG